MTPKLDGRSQADLARRMLRDAGTLLGPDGQPVEPGRIGGALIATAARLFEEVTRRLDRVPEKQADNFYSAMGLGRDPAQPATVPVAITLTDTALDDLVTAIGTKLIADTGAPTPAIFETTRGIALARGKVSALSAADLAEDRIFVAPGAVTTPALPRPAAIARFVRSAAAPGATMLQIDPAQGLVPGLTLRFGGGVSALAYDVVKVENDVVTFAPPLGEQVAERAPVTEVAIFAPFETGARDRQFHALYLGHSTLLDVPAALTIGIGGVASRNLVEWQWFGRKAADPESSPPDWQSFDNAQFTSGRWQLTKAKGKLEKTDVAGRNTLWIRGRLAGGSDLTERTGPITLSVAGAICSVDHHARCEAPENAAAPAIDYEAVAVTTPIVPNKPYYPFGREPRLFDAFYVGCTDAFGKAGAQASLCFTIGGATLGPLAAVSSGGTTLVFGVGTDRQLYAATLGDGRSLFTPVPGPRLADRPIPFATKAPLSARIDDGRVRLAVAGESAVHVAEFALGVPMTEGRLQWQVLAMDNVETDKPIRNLFVSGDSAGTVHAVAGTRIVSWSRGPTGEMVLQAAIENAIDLIPVQGTDMDAALLVFADQDAGWQIDVKRGTQVGRQQVGQVEPHALPEQHRAAWASSPALDVAAVYIAGFDIDNSGRARLGIRRVDGGDDGWQPEIDDDDTVARPITFEPGEEMPAGISGATLPPTMIVAAENPIRFIARSADHYVRTAGITAIGASANDERSFLTRGAWTFVQNGDQGLLYRAAASDGITQKVRFQGTARYGVDAADVPADGAYFDAAGAANGEGFVLAADNAGNKLVLPLAGNPDPLDTFGKLSGRVLAPDAETGTIASTGTGYALTDSTGSTSSAARTVDLFLTDNASQPLGIWHLQYDSTAGEWRLPQDAALPPAATDYTLLRIVPNAGGQQSVSLTPREYVTLDPAEVARVEALLASGPVLSFYAGTRLDAVEVFDGVAAIRMVHAELAGAVFTLLLPQMNWSMLGPDQPANPALSWEYWNGSSWWALDSTSADFFDDTGNLLVTGGLYFRVPDDLLETEVGGRKNRWIRGRLVGGDYGEARVSVHTQGAPPDQTQTITRDLSSIRAPYVVDLKIGYCAATPTLPEIVLTADNLGTLDQTEANKAGLPVTVFQTVADALLPAPATEPRVSDVAECCGRSAPPEPEPEPNGAGETPAPATARTMLIGFDRPVRGSPISLYIDALPISGDWAIAAEVFRKGRFESARILWDTSSGLGESGVIAIEMIAPADQARLLGTSAYWLRLSPLAPWMDDWSPRLRGIYLNGVMAASVETRSLETLGMSNGAPDQTFRLFANPVDSASIDLWIAEPVGNDEGEELGALPDIEGMPGPWIKWQVSPEFPPEDQDGPARVFTVDEQGGIIAFGNGRNALVPPMGSAILMRGYRHVTGASANAVAAGDKLQLNTPLVGIDHVSALDSANGGADVEPPQVARVRAPVKLLNGGRIVTARDVEEYVRARFPTVSQASAFPWRGGTRLVVVGRGTNLVPPPAALKAVGARLHDVSSFGLGAPGRLTITPPRLLEAHVGLSIDVDPGTDYSTVAEAARASIAAFLNPETGGYDQRGWTVGIAPTAADIAAALSDISAHAVVSDIVITRAKGTNPLGSPLPVPLPADVLILVARTAITVHAFAEVVA